MKKLRWADWLVILVMLGFVMFLAMSCHRSAYQKRNRCVRKYLDYYTIHWHVVDATSVRATGKIKTEESERRTGFNPDLEFEFANREQTFKDIAALCLLDDKDLVEYIFRTEYESAVESNGTE